MGTTFERNPTRIACDDPLYYMYARPGADADVEIVIGEGADTASIQVPIDWLQVWFQEVADEFGFQVTPKGAGRWTQEPSPSE